MGTTVHAGERDGTEPLELGGPLEPGRERRLLLILLFLGVAVRSVRYFLRFPLWDDEANLLASFLDRGWLELLDPLDHRQAAPPLFLWIEKAAMEVLGWSELSLRLFAYLASLASLLLFHRLAGSLLVGRARVFAVGLFAVSYPCIRYAAEAKQYAGDLLVSLVVLVLVDAWVRRPERTAPLLALAPVALVAPWLTHPAAFILGGAVLFLLARARRVAAPARVALPALALGVLLVVSFAGVYMLVYGPASASDGDWLASYWKNAMPPMSTPWLIPLWLVEVHAGEMLAYPFGGRNFGSAATLLACLAGGVALWRSERRWLLGLLLAPAGLQMLAAALGRYPYGDAFKFALHLAPAICLLAGAGLALLARAPRERTLRVVLAVLVLAGAGSIARDVARPRKAASDEEQRGFARWFWKNAEERGETLCLLTDARLEVQPDLREHLSWATMYLTNQRIYSPRHRAGLAPDLDRVSHDHPLRAVIYRVTAPGFEWNEAVLEAWIEETAERWPLESRVTYDMARYDKRGKKLKTIDEVLVLTFRPPAVAVDGYLPRE
jgi:hypothetical protein